MQAVQQCATHSPWLLAAPWGPRTFVGVQQMDRRSLVRATQLLGGSNGGRASSNSMGSHQLVQQLMVQLQLVALPMRRLQPEGCADAGVGVGVVHGTAAATRRQRHLSLHAMTVLMGAALQLWLWLWMPVMAGLAVAPLPHVLPPRAPPPLSSHTLPPPSCPLTPLHLSPCRLPMPPLPPHPCPPLLSLRPLLSPPLPRPLATCLMPAPPVRR